MKVKVVLHVAALSMAMSTLSFGSVVETFDQRQWNAAVSGMSGPTFTEDFHDGRLHMAGLEIVNRAAGGRAPGLDFEAEDKYFGASGKHAHQVDGGWADNANTLFSFTMPESIEAFSFHLNSAESEKDSPFAFVVNTTAGSQYFQLGPLDESRSPAYNGFLGIVSDARIDSFRIVSGSQWQIDNMEVVDPTPEPGALAALGLGLLGGGCAFRKLWARKK